MTRQGRAARDGDDRVRAAITSIGAHARSANLARAEQLAEAVSGMAAHTLTATQREAAVRSAHQLAGSAGTFGQAPASRLASWFERFFSATTTREPGELQHAQRQLIELRRRLAEPPELD